MNLGENIYRLRTEQNLSQGDLADALDVSRQSVSKWENNSAVPELDKLIRLAQIFSVTLDELTGYAAPQPQTVPSAPQPQQQAAPAAPQRPGLEIRQIVGIVLLGLSALTLLAYFILELVR